MMSANNYKKHLKNVGPIRHCEPLHAACSNFTLPFTRCRYCRTSWQCKIDVHDDNDNAWLRGPLWPHRMGPINDLSVMSHLATLSRNFYSCVKFAGVTWHVAELRNSFPEQSAACNFVRIRPTTRLRVRVTKNNIYSNNCDKQHLGSE